jgi:hypothetical protein
VTAPFPTPRPAEPPRHPTALPGPAFAQAAALALLAAAILLAYAPAVIAGLGFVSDDFMILQRLRGAGGLRGAVSFFGQSYYDYYRPLGFVSFAADWTLWRDWPAGYHATSILMHLLNTALAFLLARRLAGVQAAAVAAAIFGLHVANQEAVFWASARFDLLATAGALGSLLLLGSGARWRHAAAGLLYGAALLSKESVVALPVAAGAYLWLIRRERPSEMVRAFAWMGAAAVAYVLLRQASGLAASGGASRLPKLAVLAALPLLQLAAAHPSTAAVRGWLWDRRNALAAGIALLLLAAGGAMALSEPGSALHRAFGALGFAALHLLSPISPSPWLNPLPGWLSVVGLAAAGALVTAAWRLAGREVPAFIGFLLVAALLPVSSMTEGSRYFYLASVPVAIFAAWAMSAATPRAAAPAYTVLAAALIVFGWQVREKGRDWLWASDMTSRAVATIVEASGPGCRGANVYLATAPVRVRGVYANINAEGLAALGGCTPASVTTLVRLGHEDPDVAADLTPDRLTLRVDPYAGGLVTSADLQRFNIQIAAGAPTVVMNPLGRFDAAPEGQALVIGQAFNRRMNVNDRWFVFGRGRLRFLPFSSPVTASTPGRR